MSFIFRPRRWRLQRAMLDQVGRDDFRYVVTLSNGPDLATGFSRSLLVAWLRAWAVVWCRA